MLMVVRSLATMIEKAVVLTPHRGQMRMVLLAVARQTYKVPVVMACSTVSLLTKAHEQDSNNPALAGCYYLANR